MSKEPLMVPFDENGNQMHYPYCGALPPEWRVNTEFRETLRITDFSRGRSAAYFHAEGQSGVKYTIFLTDLFASRRRKPGQFHDCIIGVSTSR